jgi:hypothetical protein
MPFLIKCSNLKSLIGVGWLAGWLSYKLLNVLLNQSTNDFLVIYLKFRADNKTELQQRNKTENKASLF